MATVSGNDDAPMPQGEGKKIKFSDDQEDFFEQGHQGGDIS
jgi:hypothetical protein